MNTQTSYSGNLVIFPALEDAPALVRASDFELVFGGDLMDSSKNRITSEFLSMFPKDQKSQLSEHGEQEQITLFIRDEISNFTEFLRYSKFAIETAGFAGTYGDYEITEPAVSMPVVVRLPAWSPQLFQSNDYLGPVIAFRRSRVKLKGLDLFSEDGLLQRICQTKIELARIPKATFSTSSTRVNRSTTDKIFSVEIPKDLHISVIIPTSGKLTNANSFLIEKCIETLVSQEFPYGRISIVIVLDRDHDPKLQKHLSKFLDDRIKITVVEFNEDFNFSRKCNLGAESSHGDVLVFLNDDILLNDRNCLAALIPDLYGQKVGAVGGLLLYEDLTIQHAGISLAGPKPRNLNSIPRLPFEPETLHSREVSAITGALLAIKRHDFLQLGGWDEEFGNSYNDVALCLSLADQGLSCVLVPNAQAIHLESQTRDQGFNQCEFELLVRKWERFISCERYSRTSSNWNLNFEPARKSSLVTKQMQLISRAISLLRRIGIIQIAKNLKNQYQFKSFVKENVSSKEYL